MVEKTLHYLSEYQKENFDNVHELNFVDFIEANTCIYLYYKVLLSTEIDNIIRFTNIYNLKFHLINSHTYIYVSITNY